MTGPETPAQMLTRAMNLYRKDRLSEAGNLAGEVFQLDPNNGGAPFLLGMIALRNRSWELAAKLLTRATQLDPGKHYYLNPAI